MTDRPPPPGRTPNYREAISQWQLAARTEVKRSSSLPSSMFDACDPMLEARLADSVEAMLTCLHQPQIPATETEPPVDMHTEAVTADELRMLPALLPAADHAAVPDLDAGLTGEYLAILMDLCTRGTDGARSSAGRMLARDFAIDGSATAADIAAVLRRCIDEHRRDPPGAPDEAAIAELCLRIAADVLVDLDGAAP